MASDLARTDADGNNIRQTMGCARELYCLPRAPGMIQNRRVSAGGVSRNAVIVNRVRFVIRRVSVDPHAMHAVTLEIMVRAGRTVNRNLMEIRPTKTTDLCIGIGEQTSLQQRIVGEVQSRTICPGWKAACSFSAKKLSGLRLSTILPTR